MPSARDAKDWAAAGALHGIGDSLYTPFSGTDGDDQRCEHGQYSRLRPPKLGGRLREECGTRAELAHPDLLVTIFLCLEHSREFAAAAGAGQPFVVQLYAVDGPAGALNLVGYVEATLGYGF